MKRSAWALDLFEEKDTKALVFTGKDLSQVHDTLHYLEPEQSGSSAPVTSISTLRSLLAPLPGSAQNIPATYFSFFQGGNPCVSDGYSGYLS